MAALCYVNPATNNLSSNDCNVKNVHITLGDYFVDGSEVIYRIGYMVGNSECP